MLEEIAAAVHRTRQKSVSDPTCGKPSSRLAEFQNSQPYLVCRSVPNGDWPNTAPIAGRKLYSGTERAGFCWQQNSDGRKIYPMFWRQDWARDNFFALGGVRFARLRSSPDARVFLVSLPSSLFSRNPRCGIGQAMRARRAEPPPPDSDVRCHGLSGTNRAAKGIFLKGRKSMQSEGFDGSRWGYRRRCRQALRGFTDGLCYCACLKTCVLTSFCLSGPGPSETSRNG